MNSRKTIKSLMFLFSFLVGLTLISCGQPNNITPSQDDTNQKENDSCNNVVIADPAATYCAIMDYQYKIVDSDNGQIVMCVFPDSSSCDEWDFYSGKCGKQFSYCIQNNYELKTMNDGNDPYSEEYAICVDDQGNTVGSIVELIGLVDLMDKCP